MDCKKKYASYPEKAQKQFDAMACTFYDKTSRHRYRGDFNNKENPSIFYKNCIGNHYNGKWASIINYFPKWNSGILPFSGGYLDQPAKFVEIMDLVHNLTIENEKEKERQQEIINRTRSGKRPSKR